MTQSSKNEQREWLEVNPPPVSEEKILYCVCYTILKKGRWRARREYMHAEDQQRAKLAFAASMPPGFAIGFNVEVQGVAPAIGAFEEEEKVLKGNRLDNLISVD